MNKKKKFTFGIESLEKDYKKVKMAIQCPHIYKKISITTVNNAGLWVGHKWNRNADYKNILKLLGVEIIED